MTIAHDLRSAVRSLGRSPGFTAMAVLALALGIGANAAIFSLVNSVMLRPLPYRDVDRLYLAHLEIDGGDHLGPQRMPWSYPKWERFTHLEVPFESLAGFAEDSFNLTSGGDPEALTEAGNHWFDAVGRVRAGTTPERLAGAMCAAGTAIDAAFQRQAEINDGSTWTAAATSLVAARRDPALRRALLVLLGAVAAVLLIACANLGNLLLVRATARRREIAVRSALGASRGQLVRQMLAESVVLAGFGGASGLLVARWTLTGLAAIRPGTLEGWGVSSTEGLDLASATIDLRVVAFGFALALLVGVATGL